MAIMNLFKYWYQPLVYYWYDMIVKFRNDFATITIYPI